MKHLLFYSSLILFTASSSQTVVTFNTNEITGVYFSITNIVSRSGDTLIAEVNAGSRDGLIKGSKGGVLTRESDTIKDRGNEVVASSEVMNVFDDHATVRIIEDHPNDPKKQVIRYDNIYLKVYTPRGMYPSIFWELAKLNIYLLDESREAFIDYQKTIRIKSKEEELDYMQKYILSLHNTLNILDTTSAALTEKIEEGKFKNQPLFYTLKNSSIYDGYAFIDFVITFPARYMGKSYKFNETFATWALNGCIYGKNTKPWLSYFVLNSKMEDLPLLLLDAKYYFEADTLDAYISALDPFSREKQYDEAISGADKFIFIARETHNKPAELTFQYYKASTLNNKEAYSKALELWNVIIKENPAYHYAYIGRSYTDYKLNDYSSAIKDLEVALKKYPNYASGWGNIGWYCILNGDMEKATTSCRKAYEIDSTSYVYSVNYGHTYLLNGNTTEAKKYYSKTLELLSSTEEYSEGPKKDFELFFIKGWKRKEVGEIMDWMENEYEIKYRIKLENNATWDAAKALADDKEYARALDSFLLYIHREAQAYAPRYLSIHNAYTWTALCYEYLNQRDSCLAQHQKTLRMARELKNAQSEINDLKRIAVFYEKDDPGVSKVYENAANALNEKLADESRSNNLFILSIGLNAGSAMQLNYAENAAAAVADSLQRSSGKVFNKVWTQILNRRPTADSIEAAFKSIAKKSKPGDTFIFYFSGNAENNEKDFELLCFNNTKVTSRQLSAWFSRVEATHQCIILDAPASAFISRYINAENFDVPGHDVFLLCPMQLSIEDINFKQSLFTHELLSALHEANNAQGVITAKSLDAFMFAKLGREGYYLQTQSFSFGKDFPLGSAATGIDNQVSMPKRGAELLPTSNASDATGSASVSHQVRKDYALLFATYTYDEWNNLVNPKKDMDDIARELRNNYGFDVEVVYNATANQMKSKLREYIRKQYTDSDQLFLFFAGHGVYDEETKEGFIVCKDAKLNDENKNQYLSYADLREKINSIKCNHIFMCLDVCFGGTFDQRIARSDRGDADNRKITKYQYIESKREYKTRRFITSGGKKYVPDGLPNHNSPFAARLLEGFRNTGVSRGYLSFSMLCANMEGLNPDPRYGEFGDNEPGSEFIFDYQPDKSKSTLPSQQKASEKPVVNLGSGR
jgi:tetratricopeptide (TPR) repeat protein